MFDKVYYFMLKIFDAITVIIFTGVVSIICINVFLRYGFGTVLGGWGEELTGFGLVWIAFLISIRLVEEEGHFQVDLIVDEIIKSEKIRKGFYLFLWASMIVFFAIVIYHSRVFLTLRTYAITIPIKKSYVYGIVPISFGISIIVLLRKLIKLFFIDKKFDKQMEG